MTKINPFDLPPEAMRKIRITLTNIKWSANPERTIPASISVPVDSSLPEEEMIAKAMDIASSATGFCILDCDVEPVDLPYEDSLSDTMDYEGDIF